MCFQRHCNRPLEKDLKSPLLPRKPTLEEGLSSRAEPVGLSHRLGLWVLEPSCVNPSYRPKPSVKACCTHSFMSVLFGVGGAGTERMLAMELVRTGRRQ